MPSIIRVAWRSKNAPEEVRTSYDLGRELIALGRALQREDSDALPPLTQSLWWNEEHDLAIAETGQEAIGSADVEEAYRGQTMCAVRDDWEITPGNPYGQRVVIHERCNEYRDGVVTSFEDGHVISFPWAASKRGFVRV